MSGWARLWRFDIEWGSHSMTVFLGPADVEGIRDGDQKRFAAIRIAREIVQRIFVSNRIRNLDDVSVEGHQDCCSRRQLLHISRIT
jgi:hypothetical protein